MTEKLYQSVAYRPCELEHHYGDQVHILSNPYLLTELAALCSPEVGQPRFNDLIEVCYRGLLERVVCAEFPHKEVEIPTRMLQFHEAGIYRGVVIDPATPVATVNIARAGTLPSHICYHQLNHLLNPSGVRQDHVIMERTTDASGRVTGAGMHGSKIGGDIEGRILLFPDPMAATGSSLSRVIDFYKQHVDGVPAKIIALHLIVTPDYLRTVLSAHPEVYVYALRLDRGTSPAHVFDTVPGTHWEEESGLNERQYIVPGGGGFGEILNNANV
ncbi:MAG: uracil phosphoribosyltransferase [Planctomycetota bacterium]